jgi:hypothetical protein
VKTVGIHSGYSISIVLTLAPRDGMNKINIVTNVQVYVKNVLKLLVSVRLDTIRMIPPETV